MATDTNLDQLIINKLTQAQYAAASEAGAISETELYLITDGEGASTSSGGVPIVTAESSDGIAYTATVDGVDALEAGQLIVFLSTKTSASTAPTLDVNGLGAKTIKRRLSNLSSTTAAGLSNNWLYANKPQFMMYDGTYWIVVNQDKPAASDLYGAVPVAGGGTGATDAETARTNLEVYSKTEVDAAITAAIGNAIAASY